MEVNKGGRGHRDPNALRRTGVRLPIVPAAISSLLDAIVETRGGNRTYHVTQALIRYATEEEVEKAGLVE